MEGSGRRKRKMGNEEEKDDEDDEEKKVEKFFALIRSTREVRDRLRNVAVQNVSEEKEIQKKIEEEKAAAAADADGRWNPAFQPEDFMEGSVSGSKDPLVLSDASASPSSEIKHGPEKESKDGGGEGGGGGGLDLNLSLSL